MFPQIQRLKFVNFYLSYTTIFSENKKSLVNIYLDNTPTLVKLIYSPCYYPDITSYYSAITRKSENKKICLNNDVISDYETDDDALMKKWMSCSTVKHKVIITITWIKIEWQYFEWKIVVKNIGIKRSTWYY